MTFVGARITAYCSCEKCCGPRDRSGPVVGAAGVELVPGYSCAGPKELPFGTLVQIDGKEYRVDDRTADWVQRKHGVTFDIYFGTHQDALDYGRRFVDVEVLHAN